MSVCVSAEMGEEWVFLCTSTFAHPLLQTPNWNCSLTLSSECGQMKNHGAANWGKHFCCVCWYGVFLLPCFCFPSFSTEQLHPMCSLPLQCDNLQKHVCWLWKCFRVDQKILANDFPWRKQQFVTFEGAKPKCVSCFRTVPYITAEILLMQYI